MLEAEIGATLHSNRIYKYPSEQGQKLVFKKVSTKNTNIPKPLVCFVENFSDNRTDGASTFFTTVGTCEDFSGSTHIAGTKPSTKLTSMWTCRG